ELFGDTVEEIKEIDPLREKILKSIDKISIFPSSHYITSDKQRKIAMTSIHDKLQKQLSQLNTHNKLLKAQQLEQRTIFDLEMMEQIKYYQNIENYSRHLNSRLPGKPPPYLLDYFPKNFLLIIDESHQTIPQI